MLEAHEITVRLGGKAVLKGVSAAIAPGTVTGIIGPNGAGKSTLVAVLTAALIPQAGRADIDGTPLSTLSIEDLALRRAVLEQTPALTVPFSIQALLELAIPRALPPHEAQTIAERALAAMDLKALAERRINTLSGGEAHRAHMARTLAQLWGGQALGSPGYLLVDEPTASLDLTHQRAVLRAARQAAHDGAGVGIVLHDLSLAAAVADRLILLQGGAVQAAGPVDAVIRPEVLEPVYHLPIEIIRAHNRPIVVPRMDGMTSTKESQDVRRHEQI